MKKRGWKLCSLVLSTAMAATCLPAGTVKVRAAEEEGAAAGEENGIVKTTEAVIQDDFTGGLGQLPGLIWQETWSIRRGH